MSDTDSTYSMNPRAARPTALGDLRFAGTIAAGLVAGTLGLGALAAPLVGWKDWPSALTQQASSQPVVLAKAEQAKARNEQTPRKGGRPAPGGASVLDNLGLPGAGGPAAASTPGGLATFIADPTASGPSTRAERERAQVRAGESEGTATPAVGESEFTPQATFQQTDFDNNLDGVKDQTAATFGKTDATGNAIPGQASGLSAATEFKIRSTNMWADTNQDGYIDGKDDSDRDGVSNEFEDKWGTDPTLADSDGDGRSDGLEDRDADGYPDGLPVPPPPVEEPPAEEPPVTVAPPVEPAPVDDGSTAPPPQDPPTVGVDEPTPPSGDAPSTEAPAPAPETPAPATDAPVVDDPATTPEESAPADDAPASVTEAPKEEAPAPKEESSAPKEEAPAPKEETPAPKEEAPKAEAPAAEAPAPAPEAPAPAPEAPAPAPEAPAPAPEAPAPAAAPAEQAPAPAQEAAPAPAEQADPAATPAW